MMDYSLQIHRFINKYSMEIITYYMIILNAKKNRVYSIEYRIKKEKEKIEKKSARFTHF